MSKKRMRYDEESYDEGSYYEESYDGENKRKWVNSGQLHLTTLPGFNPFASQS